MNYAAKVILQPTAEDVHVYSSYFMTKLLGIGLNTQRPQEPTGYDYSAVRQWTHRIRPNAGNIPPAERINRLKALYVTINKGNTHWLYMKVIPTEKRIQLRDSLGVVAGNNQYMENMLRYLYDVWRETHPDARCDFVQWSREWTCEDLSGQTPKQLNGRDCGLFTLSTCTSTCKGYNSAEIHIINNGSTLNTPGGDWHTYYGNQELVTKPPRV